MLPSEADLKERCKVGGGWLPIRKPDPISMDAQTLYAEQGKKLRRSVDVTRKHADLQRESWTDKVFLGDNTETTALLSQSAA